MPLDSTCALPGYEILGPIGRGSTGRVELARQIGVDRLVAVKWLDVAEGPGREHQLARLRREATLMGQVSHPNVLTIYSFEVARDGTPYLILEYVEAGDLRHVLRLRGRLAPDEALAIVLPVCDAVLCLHEHGILHRDLKPENILMHRGAVPKVADFGIARPRELDPYTALHDDNLPSGTDGYVAPEQRYGLAFDERADQYSLAAITYELLAGEKPLGAFPPPSACNPRVDGILDRVLRRALSDSPVQRYPTLREFRDDLARALAPPPISPAHPRPRRILRVLGIALLALVVLRVAVVIPRAQRQRRERQVAAIQGGDPGPKGTSPTAEVPPGIGEATPPPRAHVPPSVQEQLVQLWAYRLWQLQGKPQGEEGHKAGALNLEAAARLVQEESSARARRLWIERGSRIYHDQALDAAESARNWADAQAELLTILKAGLPVLTEP